MLLNAGEGEGKVGTAPTVGRVFLHHCTYHPVVLNNSSALLPNCEFSQGPSLSSPTSVLSQHTGPQAQIYGITRISPNILFSLLTLGT